jgi:hypothetical protein
MAVAAEVLGVPLATLAEDVENDNDPKIIGESQQYLRDFSRVVSEEPTAAAIVARMVERYPDWGNLDTLWHSAKTAAARNAS